MKALSAAVLMLLCAVASAQTHQHDPGPADERVDLQKLPPPQHLSGIGASHIALTTRSARAQEWFDQGLALMHCFWDYEALRAFEQAVRLDPDCALCHWGLYLALDFENRKEQAKEELALARKLSAKASDHEQRYIRAESASVETAGEGGEKAYAREMEALIDRYPDDVQAKLLYAAHIGDGYDASGDPRPGTLFEQTLLRSVLAQNPDDAAANHYWVHAEEASGHPERALESAQKLGRLAPASGHIVHMPGHIYYRLGDYERAREIFLAAMKVDEAYMAAQHVAVRDDWNYTHNLSYLVAACAEGGRYAEARAHAGTLQALSDGPDTSNAGFAVLQVGATQTRLAIRYGRWDEAINRPLAFAVPEEKLPVWARDYRDGLQAYARGMQALELGRPAEADSQSAQMDSILWRLGQEKLTGLAPHWQERASKLLSTGSLELRASIAAARGDFATAEALFRQTDEAERKLNYTEPPQYARPAHEAQGAAWLRAGRFAQAREAYGLALAQRPRSGFALFGIAQAWDKEGKRVEAIRAYREFLGAWAAADADLPQVRAAQAYLAANAATAAR